MTSWPTASAQGFGVQSPHGFRGIGIGWASVFCLDTTTGLVWSYDTGDDAWGIAVDSTGLIYIGHTGGFDVLNAAGVLQYKVVLAGSVIAGMAIGASDDLYVGSDSHASGTARSAKFAVGATSPAWSVAQHGDGVVWDGSNPIFTGFANALTAKRAAASGTALWNFGLGSSALGMDPSGNPVLIGMPNYQPPTYIAGLKLKNSDASFLAAYVNGIDVWTIPPGGLVDAAGQVYALRPGLSAATLFSPTGTVLRGDGFPFTAVYRAALARDGNYLVTSKNLYSVFKVNAATGAILWQWGGFPTGGGQFVANGPGNIVYLTHTRTKSWNTAA